jgi:MFS transporter, DHA1 family, inner membrane transport protein
MIVFGLLGFVLMALVAIFVRRSVSEVKLAEGSHRVAVIGGAPTLHNRNTYLLVSLSAIAGLAAYGFLGMYPTYLREQLNFTPADTGTVMSIFGLGALASVGGGFLGDKFPMRPMLVTSLLAQALIGWLLFNGPVGFAGQAPLAFAWGVVAAGTIYVNVAAYHVKAVSGELAACASGVFVTSFYTAASVAGYTIGWLAREFSWALAGTVQLSLICIVGAVLVLALKPDLMTRQIVERP